MTTTSAVSDIKHEPELPGQTVVVIGGSSGIGLETARRARAEGADVILTGRDPERLQRAAVGLGALRIAAFDATDPAALDRFFQGLPEQIDHVMVTAPVRTTRPWPTSTTSVRTAISMRILAGHSRSPSAPSAGYGPAARCCSWAAPAAAVRVSAWRSSSAGAAALPALIANLALEVAPVRVNLDRGRLCRHAAVRIAARRRPRQAPRPAPRDAAYRARGRAGRRRRARRPRHGRHRSHRCGLRRRRGSAARLRLGAPGNKRLLGPHASMCAWRHWVSSPDHDRFVSVMLRGAAREKDG